MGAWLNYGLGSESRNLPGYVVLTSGRGTSGGASNWSSGNLPSTYAGVLFRNYGDPVLNLASPAGLSRELERKTISTIGDLNREHHERMGDAEIQSRIAAYELAFRMQSAVPEVMDLKSESQSTLDLYGIGRGPSDDFGRQCLLARRFAEAGVRYIECTHGNWDQHNGLRARLTANCGATDQPMAGLLADLEQRGMLDETLVVWGGEFGRTPHCRNTDGRDHNSTGFSFWMAGGGVKGGMRYGATDEYGIAAVENKMHFHDLHATMLHLLGLDHTKLTYRYAGRDFRLTDVFGRVASEIIA
jgi:hypothetical protein